MTMRHQTLVGFALHQRRYRERSHILYFFTQEFGRVDGVIRQLPPSLYHLASVQANGKSELKNFSQLDMQGQPFYLQQKGLFAGFYLNELLLRLLPLEEPMPQTYQAYCWILECLKTLPNDDVHNIQLKIYLRKFEQILLQELGYDIDFYHDCYGQQILAHQYYAFLPKEGFQLQKSTQGFLGQDLLALAGNAQINLQNIDLLSRLYRLLLAELLGHKPLKSRQLWLQQHQLK